MAADKRTKIAEMIADTAGRLYDANFDPQVIEALGECKELCYDYNQLRPREVEARTELLRTIVGSMGEHATIQQPFWCDYGRNIHLGENFYANHGLTVLDCTWPLTALSPRRGTPSTPSAAIRAWSMRCPSRWATTCGWAWA